MSGSSMLSRLPRPMDGTRPMLNWLPRFPEGDVIMPPCSSKPMLHAKAESHPAAWVCSTRMCSTVRACEQNVAADLWRVVGHQLVQVCRLEGAQVQLAAGQGAGLRFRQSMHVRDAYRSSAAFTHVD